MMADIGETIALIKAISGQSVSDLKSAIDSLEDDLTDVSNDVYGKNTVIGSLTVNNTLTYIGVNQTKISLDVKAGEKVTVNVSGTAFTNESVCTLYFYFENDTSTAVSQGAITIGKDKEFVLSTGLKYVAIYALPIVEGTVVIAVSKVEGGICEYATGRNFYKGVAESGYWTGTSMTTSSSYGHTPPIELKAGDYLFTSTEGLMGANGKTAIIVNSQGTPISSITGSSVGNKTETGVYNSRPILKFTLSADSYVSFNIGALTGSTTAIYNGNFMVVRGETLADFPNYEPYVDPYLVLKPTLKLTNSMISQVNGLSGLIGKTAIFDGDSICKGTINGTTPEETDGWAGYICPANEMVWKNYGVSGGVITSATNPAVSGKHSVVDNIDTMYGAYPNADFVIFEGGTNDADLIGSAISDPTVLGTYSITDYVGPFDATTFTGALETIFSKAISYWKGKKIGYIVAQKMGYGSGYYDAEHDNRRAYFARAIEICEKWGIPYINLWDGCYLNPTNPNCYDKDKSKDQNISGGYLYTDGQHLTKKGYEYISPMIEAWMKTL